MARRANLEGSVYQRKDGRWVASLQYTDPTGKTKRVSRYAKTQREAKDQLRGLHRSQEDGVQLVSGSPTVAEYLTRWLEHSAKPSVRPKTFADYESIVTGRVIPRVGKLRLVRLTPERVAQLYADLEANGLSKRSVLNTHRVLRRSLAQAVKWGLLVRNPCDAVDAPRPPRTEMRTLSAGQVARLFEDTKDDRAYALYVTAVTTGLRLGELLGLKWDDFDVEDRRLSVRRSLQRVKGRGRILTEPKTSRSRRTVMLSKQAVSALKEHRRRQLEERLLLGPAWADNDLVFTDAFGGPLDPGGVTRHFKVRLRRAGLPEIRFHDLRHTAATLLLQAGTHPKVVSDMLGHSTTTLTLDTYSHVVPAMHAEAAATMDRLLGGA